MIYSLFIGSVLLLIRAVLFVSPIYVCRPFDYGISAASSRLKGRWTLFCLFSFPNDNSEAAYKLQFLCYSIFYFFNDHRHYYYQQESIVLKWEENAVNMSDATVFDDEGDKRNRKRDKFKCLNCLAFLFPFGTDCFVWRTIAFFFPFIFWSTTLCWHSCYKRISQYKDILVRSVEHTQLWRMWRFGWTQNEPKTSLSEFESWWTKTESARELSADCLHAV